MGTLVALLWSRARGSETVDISHRTIADAEVRQAVTVIASFISVLVAGVFALLVTEHTTALASGLIGAADVERGLFLEVVFEAFSALGTVGLSTGFTSEVSLPGRLVLVALMYVGRVGPVTVALGMAERQKRSSFCYPEESVLIG
jgi:trk system potassium uptake protein TrkH